MLIHLVRLSFVIVAIAVAFTACGDSKSADADPFDTYQACFTEHHVTEAFTVQKTITICCLDHAIGANAAGIVCGATTSTCGTYVTANLGSADATSADITSACADYVTQKGM